MSRDLTITHAPDLPWVPQRFYDGDQAHDLRFARRFSMPLNDLAPLMTQFGSNYGRFLAVPKAMAYTAGDSVQWQVIRDTAGWYDHDLWGVQLPATIGASTFHVTVRLVSGVNNQPVSFSINNIGFGPFGSGDEPSNGAGVDSAAAHYSATRRVVFTEGLEELTVNVTSDFTPADGFASYFAVTQLGYDDT